MAWKPLERPSKGPYTPCLGCGVLIQVERGSKTGARCWRCEAIREYDYPKKRGERTSGLTSRQRGYDRRWFRLSKQARRLQPWCSDCGSPDDLTGDHLRWPARTLADVDVLCRSCNSSKGAIR
jgi:5-methylcytosine-specific restriction endonuclease McrA